MAHKESSGHTDDGTHSDHAASILTPHALTASRAPSDTDTSFLQRAAATVPACQADPSCDLNATAAAAGAADEASEVQNLEGLKVGLAAAFLATTLVGSMLPQVFKRWRNSSGVLTLFNVFSGAVFLTVGTGPYPALSSQVTP